MNIGSRQIRVTLGLLVLAISAPVVRAAEPVADLRKAVPPDVYMVMYSRHNPERDFQKKYYSEIWDTVRETKIIDRFVGIITRNAPANELEEVKSVLDEIKQAASPIDWNALTACKESVYAQTMEFPSSHHLGMVRLTPEAAASTAKGVTNLFSLIEKKSGGRVPVRTANISGVQTTMLELPPQIPMQPAIATVGDVFVFSTSETMLRNGLDLLAGSGGASKFDEPRIKEALGRLPKAEDSVVLTDGKLQFSQFKKAGTFIRQMGAGNPDADRIATLIDSALDEIGVLDYDITVGYTDGNQNRTSSVGKILPGGEDKLLGKVLGSGKEFDNWGQWVPADATGFSLWTGVNLHHAYEWAVDFLQTNVPEAQEILDQAEGAQMAFGVHLDRDILQAFSGESISISLPAANPNPFGGGAGGDSVTMLRCSKPERIRELLHRLFDTLQQIPQVQQQQLQLKKVPELEGFEEISFAMLAMVGARPVIGFRDGWMIIGSNPQAVQKVFDTKASKGVSFRDSDAFEQFNLKVEGPVRAISYSNLAQRTRAAAQLVETIAGMAPLALGMLAQENPEAGEVLQEIVALLPSVAQIIRKFDFLEAQLSVTQSSRQSGTYIYTKRSATLVRPASGN